MRNIIYVLLDGVGDRPNLELNYMTPLEAAYTPNLDLITRKGAAGIVFPVGSGVSPESDIAVFCMLGYNLSSNYFGRGVVEAVGIGMDFRNGDLALRANFATQNEEGILIDRRAGRDITQEQAIEMAKAINELELSHNAEFEFIPTVAHRAVLKIRIEGRILSADIENTDPAYTRIVGMGVAKKIKGKIYLQKAKPLNETEEARLSAELVNEFTDKAISILKTHKVNRDRERNHNKAANVLLLRDAGNKLPDIRKIPDIFGVKIASILDMPVEKGIAKITGMHEHKVAGIGDYAAKANKAIELLENYDGVYIHIKGPDEPGHDGDAELKTKVIEQIDKEFFRTLINHKDADKITFAISADHSTPCNLRGHSADPVPLVISGPKVTSDNVCRFTEKEAARGSLGIMKGIEVLPLALSYI